MAKKGNYFLIAQKDNGELRVGKSIDGTTLVDNTWWPIQHGYSAVDGVFYSGGRTYIKNNVTGKDNYIFLDNKITTISSSSSFFNTGYFPLTIEKSSDTDLMIVKDYYLFQLKYKQQDDNDTDIVKIFYVQLSQLLAKKGDGNSSMGAYEYTIGGEELPEILKNSKELKVRVKARITGTVAEREIQIIYKKKSSQGSTKVDLGTLTNNNERIFEWLLPEDDIIKITFRLISPQGKTTTMSLNYIEIFAITKTQIESFSGEELPTMAGGRNSQ